MIKITASSEVRVKSLPAADKALVGTSVIDFRTDNGEVGRLVEDIIDSAQYHLDREGTVDLKIAGVDIEVKSRKEKSLAAHSIGSMTVKNIIATPYDQSPIWKKIQHQYRVKHNGETIVSAEIFDITDSYFQDKFRSAYEHGRTLMALGEFDQLGKGPNTRWAYWEKKSKNSYAFRIRDKAMRNVEKNKYSMFSSLVEK